MPTVSNGTTAAAIEVFEEKARLRELMKAATAAAYDRSVELSNNG
ncbi:MULTISPECIES: pyrroline-5-carboxylate reductase dimerization domain-containing protein [unclassified Pseudomonas]